MLQDASNDLGHIEGPMLRRCPDGPEYICLSYLDVCPSFGGQSGGRNTSAVGSKPVLLLRVSKHVSV